MSSGLSAPSVFDKHDTPDKKSFRTQRNHISQVEVAGMETPAAATATGLSRPDLMRRSSRHEMPPPPPGEQVRAGET